MRRASATDAERTERAFIDFAVEILPGLVKGGSPEVGAATAPLASTFNAVAFRDAVERLTRCGRDLLPERSVRAPSASASAEQLGAELFDAIVVGEVRSRLDAAVAIASVDGRGVRLRLTVGGDDPGLAAIPWEILRDPRSGEFVCLHEGRQLVRDPVVAEPIKPLAVRPPLRILGVAANAPGLTHLNLSEERRRVEQVVRPIRAVALEWLTDPTPSGLLDVLRRGRFHVLHFAGHGGVDADGRGFVALSEGGAVARLHADDLGVIFARHPSLRLVVLNSCQGAVAGGAEVGASLATGLLRRGVPAVIAMQFPISDAGAIELSRVLYQELSRGRPPGAALADARRSLHLLDRDRAEWLTPVLYLRGPEGSLFAPPAPRSARWAAAAGAALLLAGAAFAGYRAWWAPRPALRLQVEGKARLDLGPNEERSEAFSLDAARGPREACRGLMYCVRSPTLGFLAVPSNGLLVPPPGRTPLAGEPGKPRPAWTRNVSYDPTRLDSSAWVLWKRRGLDYEPCPSGAVKCADEKKERVCRVLDEEPCF